MSPAPRRTITSWITFVGLLGLFVGVGFTAGIVTGLVLVTEHETTVHHYLGGLMSAKNTTENGVTPLPIPTRKE